MQATRCSVLAAVVLSTFAACAVDAESPDDPDQVPSTMPTAPDEHDQARLSAPELDDPTVRDGRPQGDPLAYSTLQVEGENMMVGSGVVSGTASTGYAIYGGYQARIVYTNGDIGQWFYVPETGWRGISVAMQGSSCAGAWPREQTWLYQDGRGWYFASSVVDVTSTLSVDPNPRYYPYFQGSTMVNAGWNFVLLRMSNDYAQSGCDRNIVYDYAAIWG